MLISKENGEKYIYAASKLKEFIQTSKQNKTPLPFKAEDIQSSLPGFITDFISTVRKLLGLQKQAAEAIKSLHPDNKANSVPSKPSIAGMFSTTDKAIAFSGANLHPSAPSATAESKSELQFKL